MRDLTCDILPIKVCTGFLNVSCEIGLCYAYPLLSSSTPADPTVIRISPRSLTGFQHLASTVWSGASQMFSEREVEALWARGSLHFHGNYSIWLLSEFQAPTSASISEFSLRGSPTCVQLTLTQHPEHRSCAIFKSNSSVTSTAQPNSPQKHSPSTLSPPSLHGCRFCIVCCLLTS